MLAFVAVIWFVVVRRTAVPQVVPSRAGVRIYGISVLAIVLAISLGAKVLRDIVDWPPAVPVCVVFTVGAHFLPFACVFRLPSFRWLAASMIAVAIVGAIPTGPVTALALQGGPGLSQGSCCCSSQQQDRA